jgi:hypothetical protein
MRLLRKIKFFFSVVWRPTWPPPDAGWYEAHVTYRLQIITAWEVAGALYD